MVELWLMLIGLTLIFFLGLGAFFYSIRSSVNPADSHTIDPLPEQIEEHEK
jgi:hypothetical protein